MKKIVLILMFLISSVIADQMINSVRVGKFLYETFSKTSKILPNKEIIKLSKFSDGEKGTKYVKRYIGKLNLPKEAQEDVYLRIATYQQKIERSEAEKMFKNLKGKDGFRGALGKMIGNSPEVTKGHLNELRIANNAAEKGFDVIAIGKKFDDGIKNSLTDIDVLFRKNGTEVLIEAKMYASSTKMKLDKYKGDLDTLNIYANKVSKGKTLKVFSFTEIPSDKKLLQKYKFWADKKGVQLIFGTPQQQMEQVEQLLRIL